MFLIVMTLQQSLLSHFVLPICITTLILSPFLLDPLTIVLFLFLHFFTPSPPTPPTQHQLWHMENTQCADKRDFLLDFPWNNYCFQTFNPDLAATAIEEVITSGMEACIPSSKTYSISSPWHDHTCPSALLAKEKVHQL